MISNYIQNDFNFIQKWEYSPDQRSTNDESIL